MSVKAIINDRIYVPARKVEPDLLDRVFVRSVYDEDKCDHCEYKEDRHSEVCDNCQHYKGTYKLYNEKEIGGKRYIGVPVGAKKSLKTILVDGEKLKVEKDLRKTPKFKRKIKFIREPYDYQKEAVEVLYEKGYGILESPPRSGKTPMGTYLMCKIGYKTIILAAQRDWLVQFYNTICGNKEEGVEPFTNIPQLEEEYGEKICGYAKTLKDFEKYDVCLVTYQTFLSKGGQKLLKKVKKMFGTLITDEVHDVGADGYSKVINNFQAKHRYGLSGTVDRKDGKIFIAHALYGPVVHRCKVKTLKPVVNFIETGFKSQKDYKLLVYAHRALEKDAARTKLIVKQVVKDVKDGHSVVMPVMYTSQMKMFVDEINKRAGEKIAVGFHGKLNKKMREQLLKDARSGKIKVVVGIRKIVQVGINVPAWSCLHEVSPISNPPKFTQETSRILTPVEGKRRPVIRFYLDDMGFSRGCLRTCLYKNGMLALGFEIPPPDMALARKYAAKGKITHGTKSEGVRRF